METPKKAGRGGAQTPRFQLLLGLQRFALSVGGCWTNAKATVTQPHTVTASVPDLAPKAHDKLLQCESSTSCIGLTVPEGKAVVQCEAYHGNCSNCHCPNFRCLSDPGPLRLLATNPNRAWLDLWKLRLLRQGQAVQQAPLLGETVLPTACARLESSETRNG